MNISIAPDAPKPSVLLRNALTLFGPNGEHWITGKSKQTKRIWWTLWFASQTSYCSMGAIAEVNTKNEFAAKCYLDAALEAKKLRYSIWNYNDHIAHSFEDIKARFEEAIALAEADGN